MWVNGVTTSYTTIDGSITSQNDGTNQMYFRYDKNGSLTGFNLNGTEYIYVKNAQGDVIGILDMDGNQIVSYTYDSWGKVESIIGSQASTVGAQNPMRYRGYYEDAETGFYYLQSRYYDAEVGRFLNVDEPKVFLSKPINVYGSNIYSYGKNNSVNNIDPKGELAFAIAGVYFIPGVGEIAIVATLLVLAAICVGYLICQLIQSLNDASIRSAAKQIANAASASTPPPPNKKGSKGTQVTSKTLYNKDGVRIDVENPGNRTGQIHVQKGAAKYIYNIAKQKFFATNGQLAPRAIQELLVKPDIIKAIAKGLIILGY